MDLVSYSFLFVKLNQTINKYWDSNAVLQNIINLEDVWEAFELFQILKLKSLPLNLPYWRIL